MPKLTILSGVSGSGKSTLAQELIEVFITNGQYVNYIFSTDEYFIRPDGEYAFNAKELESAHNWNFNRFVSVVEEHGVETDPLWEPADNVIIDNTNLTWWEIEKYAKLALEYGWEVEIIEPETAWKNDKDELFRLNKHNVPFRTIERQLERKESLEVLNQKLEALKLEIESAE